MKIEGIQRGVLVCLSKDYRALTIVDIRTSYNKLYPGGRFSLPVSVREVKRALDELVLLEYVRDEVRTFTNVPIPPTKFYTITPKGIQGLHHVA